MILMAAFAPSFQYEAMDINTFLEEQTSAMIIFQSFLFIQTASSKNKKAALLCLRASFVMGTLEIQR